MIIFRACFAKIRIDIGLTLLCSVYEANRDCYSRHSVHDLSLKCNQTFVTQVNLLAELNGEHLHVKKKHLCRSVSDRHSWTQTLQGDFVLSTDQQRRR